MKSTSQLMPVRSFLNFTVLMILLFTVSLTPAGNQPIVTELAQATSANSKSAGKFIPKLPKRPGYRLSA